MRKRNLAVLGVVGFATALIGALAPPTIARGSGGTTTDTTTRSGRWAITRVAGVDQNVDVWCENNPGPTIQITGDIPLGDVSGQVTLANNRKGTRIVSVDVTEAIAVKVGESYPISVPKQPAIDWSNENGGGTGVAGNPHFFAEMREAGTTNVLLNDDGIPMRYYLGRCVGPSTHLTQHILEKFPLNAELNSLVTGTECSTSRSQIETDFGVNTEGVDIAVILANQINKLPGDPGVHYSDLIGEFVTNVVGDTLKGGGKGWWDAEKTIPGPGGNPLVYSRPLAPDGDTQYGKWDLKVEGTWGLKHGRCNKLV